MNAVITDSKNIRIEFVNMVQQSKIYGNVQNAFSRK